MTQTTCPFGQGGADPQGALRLPQGYDFTDPDVLLKGIPVTEFAELRETAPVWWNEQTDSIFDDGGYWVISRHEDIKAISRNGDLWSTNRKGAVTRMPDGTTSEQLELTKALLINHDAPEHTRLRKIVSRLFTPRSVATLEEKLAVAAREIVSAAAEKEFGNFVDDIHEGGRAGLFYSSANYDENVFEYPSRFDINRDPNPHLGFGGNGAHYCIGANLARMEIKLIFNEIADQLPNIAKLSEPQRLRSGWINGVKELAVCYRA
jgi:cytochrome P450